jgi:hypothetical protein
MSSCYIEFPSNKNCSTADPICDIWIAFAVGIGYDAGILSNFTDLKLIGHLVTRPERTLDYTVKRSIFMTMSECLFRRMHTNQYTSPINS